MDTTPPLRPARPAPPGDPRHTTGQVGEDLAADFLASVGVEVVARNWRLSTGEVRGELDLVGLDHDAGLVVVCEVKTRRGDGFGGPLAAVTARKQAKIRSLAVALLAGGELPYRRVRFDVVGVRLDGPEPAIQHLPAAF